jgi:hypothetical protein
MSPGASQPAWAPPAASLNGNRVKEKDEAQHRLRYLLEGSCPRHASIDPGSAKYIESRSHTSSPIVWVPVSQRLHSECKSCNKVAALVGTVKNQCLDATNFERIYHQQNPVSHGTNFSGLKCTNLNLQSCELDEVGKLAPPAKLRV